MKLSQGINPASVARYTLLPGVVPRLRRLTQSGFGNLSFLMALVYASVGLLPADHPYVSPANKGRYGLRHVIAAAAARLVYKKENIDQILIFYTILTGLVLLGLQFAFMLFTLVIHPALAAPVPFFGMFTTPDPTRDIALMLLDSVFGIPGFFKSCISTGVSCGPLSPAYAGFPTPFQLGLQALFHYYSLAILVVAVLIFLYYVMIVIGETAQTGTPFGRRFDHVWVPIRLITAIGLLVPLGYGFNGGQYIALMAARMGSGFATNAWNLYNAGLENAIGGGNISPPPSSIKGTVPTPSGSNSSLIAQPVTPDVSPVMEFMTVVQACKYATEALYDVSIMPYLVSGNQPSELVANVGAPSWDDAVKYYNNKDIVIVFGDDGAPTGDYKSEPSQVSPLCGAITFHIKDLVLAGPKTAQQGYYDWVVGMFYNNDYSDFGVRAGYTSMGVEPSYPNPTFGVPNDKPQKLPPEEWKQQQAQAEQADVNTFVNKAYLDMVTNTDFTVQKDILDRGWGGAGIWYNHLAQWNGALFSSVKTLPSISAMPLVMERVKEARQGHDQNIEPDEIYDLNQGNNQDINFDTPEDRLIARELSEVYKYWRVARAAEPQGKPQGNIIIDTIHIVFGVDGLYSIRQNDHVNPMVQLVAIGKSILDGAMRNLFVAIGFSAVSNFIQALHEGDMHGGAGAAAFMASMMMTIVTIAIPLGVTLYYVLPFMPFLYFYFAVGAWVKSVFEAMIGAPLWALAHLKISGNGLPTESAIGGYFMILDILLRPILTVFGLIASIAVFSAMVRTMNGIFTLVTSNVTSFDCKNCYGGGAVDALYVRFKRDVLDEFFFTVIYTILAYMIGTSAFKMIDQVPDNALRWMGGNIRSFAQTARDDPVGHLAQHVERGALLVSNEILPSAVAASGKAVGGIPGEIVRRTRAAAPAEPTVTGTPGGQGRRP